MKYVIGVRDSAGKELWYNLYIKRNDMPVGPNLVPDISDAFRFPNRDYAQNVIAGDIRLGGFAAEGKPGAFIREVDA